MQRRRLVHPLFLIAAAAAVAISVHVGSQALVRKEPSRSFKGTHLRCAIQLDHPSRHLPGLTTGYNYDLLRRFTATLGDTLATIINPVPGSSWTDSLLLGKADIVVLPYSGAADNDSILFSRSIDSLTVWAVRADCRAGRDEINEWLGAFLSSEKHEDIRDTYLLRYSPAKRAEWGRTVSAISPYDSLVKAGAKDLGWDWRMLSAIIFQESQFHIESRSRRGAEGLMQMMPATAAKMGVTDLFDPEQSLKAGVKYLKGLQRMFSDDAADQNELCKFVLAAYNAGEGRLMDCINYAEAVGADSGTWEGIVSIIPEMRDESSVRVDSVIRLGTFQGVESIEFVEKVLSYFEDFKAIRP